MKYCSLWSGCFSVFLRVHKKGVNAVLQINPMRYPVKGIFAHLRKTLPEVSEHYKKGEVGILDGAILFLRVSAKTSLKQ